MSHPVRHVHWNQTWIESFAGEDCIYEQIKKKGKRKILLSIKTDLNEIIWVEEYFWGGKVWRGRQNDSIQFSYTMSIIELHAKFFIPFSHYMEKSNNTQAIELVHPDQFPSFSLWKIWLSSLHFRSWLGESNV